MSQSGQRVVIVGGGVIGIASAHYLNLAGHQVTVIDQGKIGGACSARNCGLVCPSHVLPLAEPGAIGSAAAAMLRPGGPFRIKPRFDPQLWRWLAQFARRCNRNDMVAGGQVIQPLLKSSLGLYRDLIKNPSIKCEWQEKGLLFVYQSAEALKAYTPTNELLRQLFDEPAQKLMGDELVEFEPALRPGLAGGWYFHEDAHLRPDRLLASWRSLLESHGVQFREQHALESFETNQQRTSAVVAGGQRFTADAVVVATGAWTPRLAALLKFRVPIEPGKGYSITLPRPTMCPQHPMIFPETRVAVTPFETGLRLGSIMEFAGYDNSLRPERLRLLTDGAAEYLRDFSADTSWPDKWFGWRPMTYDSVPVIGRCPNFANVFLATGHNMLGLSMAPATGKLISELVSSDTPHLPIGPYAAERFA